MYDHDRLAIWKDLNSKKMSSITLHITYNGATKKITTTKATTISQLAANAIDLFNISKLNGLIGILSHNQKQLDSSMPIRLTSLINNSKLTLTIKKLDFDKQVNVRLMHPAQGNKVKRFALGINLQDLLQQFEIGDIKFSRLNILNSRIDSDKYEQTKLGDVIGDTPNVVIRFEVVKLVQEKETILKEQQDVIKMQVKEQKERLKRQKKEEEEEEAAKKRTNAASEEVKPEDDQMDVDDENDTQDPINEVDKVEADKIDTRAGQTGYVYEEPKLQNEPQLYVPSTNSTTRYENPDEDYEMTVSQAKTYHNMIKNSMVPKKKSSSPDHTKAPTKYLVRIRFPDASILQINFLEGVSTIRFGQLIKKIDELILPQYIDLYELKLGYPPFTKLAQNFDTNNQLLCKMSDFQTSERITLVWQLTKNDLNIAKGPFVKQQNIDIKTSDDLPERVLDRNRGDLPEDEDAANHKKKSSNEGENNEKNANTKKMGLPKWLKLAKK